MRFIALVRREFQEAVGALILVTFLFVLISGVIVQRQIRYAQIYNRWMDQEPGEPIYGRHLMGHPKPLSGTGLVILFASIVLGPALATQQFWEHEKRKTWAFMLHRSVKRRTILLAKFLTAALTLVVCLGLPWTLLYLLVSKPGLFLYPPPLRTLIEGWMFVILGMVLYFGTTAALVNTRKKYTTRFFAIAFAAGVCILPLIQTSLTVCFAIIAVALVILLSDIVDTFLTREF
jgi:ABC-type transport system involved in multi-copper enzyme maturation permease subunit